MNLEYQWAITQYWFETNQRPQHVLAHDGHLGYLPALARHHPGYGIHFHATRFAVLIHNAGPGYRQEVPDTPYHRNLLGLPERLVQESILKGYLDPLVSAAHQANLATVSHNYAEELLTGKNDHWSGGYGQYLREHRVKLKGITNGISLIDKDPRDPERSGLTVGFDPLLGQFEGKLQCRRELRERLLFKPSSVHGRLSDWNKALYMNQGRLTAQKGVEALAGAAAEVGLLSAAGCPRGCAPRGPGGPPGAAPPPCPAAPERSKVKKRLREHDGALVLVGGSADTNPEPSRRGRAPKESQ
jgi:starch synthase